MRSSSTVDRLIQKTREHWADNEVQRGDDGPGSVSDPLHFSENSGVTGGLQSAHDVADWSLRDDDQDDTRFAAA